MTFAPDDLTDLAEKRFVPKFCPRCGREGLPEDALCHQCGIVLIPQRYCPVCEESWTLTEGVRCPKHDVELVAHPPIRQDTATPDGEAPMLVTVGTCAEDVKAEAQRIRLEAEGIPTFLVGERMGSASNYAVATGGWKIQVPSELAADARAILAQRWTPPEGEDDLEDAWDDLEPEPGAFRRRVMKVAIVLILVGPPVIALLTTLVAGLFP